MGGMMGGSPSPPRYFKRDKDGVKIYSTGVDEKGNRIYPKKGEPGHPDTPVVDDTAGEHLGNIATGIDPEPNAPRTNYTGLSID